MTAIEDLLSQPAPDDASWASALRRQVWSLDAIEREFAPDFDREGGGGAFATAGRPPSRDRLIEAPRGLYSEIFDAAKMTAT